MKLAPQTPAEGIMINRDWGDAKTYKVVCECGDADHAHDVWIEVDETNSVVVTTYTQQKTKWWKLNRFQKIWTLLTRGYIEYEASIIMTQQQALNYSDILKSAVEEISKQRKK